MLHFWHASYPLISIHAIKYILNEFTKTTDSASMHKAYIQNALLKLTLYNYILNIILHNYTHAF